MADDKQKEDVFSMSQKFQTAIDLINNVDEKRFVPLLSRVIQRLHLRSERTFTPEEEAQLCERLGMAPQEFEILLEALQFIYEQAAYYSMSIQVLGNHLTRIGMAPNQIVSVQRVWQKNGKELFDRLKTRTVAPQVMSGVNIQLRVEMAQSTLRDVVEPRALLEMGVRPSDSDSTEAKESVVVEFSEAELRDFFDKLETIQEQLDAISQV